ncbi:uncharacterized protein LOC113367664 [Ctenocephalides felis]|uniref:uncharacterized protein LOC113367664 n=1 Tax=Ctenocephalides felis TaxID=7515 RepID=UPI000E6E1DFA|nr:uncharacterized protein LOC113367664 [Ctenocephalides felis]
MKTDFGNGASVAVKGADVRRRRTGNFSITPTEGSELVFENTKFLNTKVMGKRKISNEVLPQGSAGVFRQKSFATCDRQLTSVKSRTKSYLKALPAFSDRSHSQHVTGS